MCAFSLEALTGTLTIIPSWQPLGYPSHTPVLNFFSPVGSNALVIQFGHVPISLLLPHSPIFSD
jgi:hypothetical protein